MGITSTGLPSGTEAATSPIPSLSAAEFAALPPQRLREALDGASGGAIAMLGVDGGVDLVDRVGVLPHVLAQPGMAVGAGTLYVQDAQRLALRAGRFHAVAERPLTEEMAELLRQTAEMANLAPTLEEAVRQVMQGVAAFMGWRAAGYRLFGSLTMPAETYSRALPPRMNGALAAAHAPRSDRREEFVLVLPVQYADQLLAMVVFAMPRPELDPRDQELLARVGGQLAAVAVRCWAQGDRMHHHVETVRQGRLTGMAELAHSLASELSQPLAAAMNYAGALRRVVDRGGRSEEDLNRLIEQLMGQVRRAGDILHSVKDFAVRRGCPLEAVNVGLALRLALELLEGELRKHEVELTLDVPADLPRVRGNGAYLEQILLCVVTQALEALSASERRRRMSVRARRVGAAVQIIVTDGSGGIPLQWREALLESFGPPGVASDPAGLATSRSLAEAQGGRLWVEEDNEGGVNFVLALPVSE